jgi:hypothetical protein
VLQASVTNTYNTSSATHTPLSIVVLVVVYIQFVADCEVVISTGLSEVNTEFTVATQFFLTSSLKELQVGRVLQLILTQAIVCPAFTVNLAIIPLNVCQSIFHSYI